MVSGAEQLSLPSSLKMYCVGPDIDAKWKRFKQKLLFHFDAFSSTMGQKRKLGILMSSL